MSALPVESPMESPVESFDPLSPVFLAGASTASAEKQSRGCSNPIRLRGKTELVNTGTGEVVELYSSDREVDGYTYTRCGNRRASAARPAAGSTRAMPGTC